MLFLRKELHPDALLRSFERVENVVSIRQISSLQKEEFPIRIDNRNRWDNDRLRTRAVRIDIVSCCLWRFVETFLIPCCWDHYRRLPAIARSIDQNILVLMSFPFLLMTHLLFLPPALLLVESKQLHFLDHHNVGSSH